MTEQEEKWDLVIKPNDRLLSVDLGELWRYRDLLMLQVKRNIIYLDRYGS